MIVLMLAVHVLAAVFWVGGMAFAYLMLRPAAGPLEPPIRLRLWRRVFARFLPWVGISIIAILASGFSLMALVFGGAASSPPYVHLMTGVAIVMMLLFLYLVYAPWRRFRRLVDDDSFSDAAKYLDQIRIIVGINLILGAIVLVVATTGRFW